MADENLVFVVDAIQVDDYTEYIVEVHHGGYIWKVKHRYSEFKLLHDALRSKHPNVEKDLLPPKKLFGKLSPTFIDKRRKELEIYLQNLLSKTFRNNFPIPLQQFLHFQYYDVEMLCQYLAERLYKVGDGILMSGSSYTFSTLELWAITERILLQKPHTDAENPNFDFGHVLDFVQSLKYLHILCHGGAVGSSTIIAEDLAFDASLFRSLKQLVADGCSSDQAQSFAKLRHELTSLSVHQSLSSIRNVLTGGCDITGTNASWERLVTADFSDNNISAIDSSVKLLTCVEFLDLSKNVIEKIENLQFLTSLTFLDLSHNLIGEFDCAHARLGNVKTLILAHNKLHSLQGFGKLYALEVLDVSCNLISELKQVDHVAHLPCLSKLSLCENAVANELDYRTQTLSKFGTRACEVCLDETTSSQKELDTAAVLHAIYKSRKVSLKSSKLSDGGSTTGSSRTSSPIEIRRKKKYESSVLSAPSRFCLTPDKLHPVLETTIQSADGIHASASTLGVADETRSLTSDKASLNEEVDNEKDLDQEGRLVDLIHQTEGSDPVEADTGSYPAAEALDPSTDSIETDGTSETVVELQTTNEKKASDSQCHQHSVETQTVNDGNDVTREIVHEHNDIVNGEAKREEMRNSVGSESDESPLKRKVEAADEMIGDVLLNNHSTKTTTAVDHPSNDLPVIHTEQPAMSEGTTINGKNFDLESHPPTTKNLDQSDGEDVIVCQATKKYLLKRLNSWPKAATPTVHVRQRSNTSSLGGDREQTPDVARLYSLTPLLDDSEAALLCSLVVKSSDSEAEASPMHHPPSKPGHPPDDVTRVIALAKSTMSDEARTIDRRLTAEPLMNLRFSSTPLRHIAMLSPSLLRECKLRGFDADERLLYITWSHVVFYHEPEAEIACAVFLSDRALYFIIDSPSECECESVCSVFELDKSRALLDSTQVRFPFHRVEKLRQVVVGPFGQSLRITSSSPAQTATLITRSSRLTENFVVNLLVALDEANPVVTSSVQELLDGCRSLEDIEVILPKTNVAVSLCNEQSMMEFNLTTVELRSWKDQESNRTPHLLLCLLVHLRSPATPPRAKTFVLTTEYCCLCDENLIAYPIPDFESVPPVDHRYQRLELVSLSDLACLQIDDVISYDVTLVLSDGRERNGEKWRLSFRDYVERDHLIHAVCDQYRVVCGEDLKIHCVR